MEEFRRIRPGRNTKSYCDAIPRSLGDIQNIQGRGIYRWPSSAAPVERRGRDLRKDVLLGKRRAEGHVLEARGRVEGGGGFGDGAGGASRGCELNIRALWPGLNPDRDVWVRWNADDWKPIRRGLRGRVYNRKEQPPQHTHQPLHSQKSISHFSVT